MPDILMPIKWLLEAILVGFHTGFTALGLNANGGFAWVGSIVGLVLLVRTALIPLFVKQIKSQRNMYAIQPELKKLADKYKGKQDRESREKFAREQMDLYKKHGSSPFSSCLPLLAQMPVFFSLYSILNEAQKGAHGVGALTTDLAVSFSHATFLGARLSETFMTATSLSVRILAAVMVILMTSSQFITLCVPHHLLVLRCVLPAWRYVLLVGVELLDHGAAIHRYSQHANPWLYRPQRARSPLG